MRWVNLRTLKTMRRMSHRGPWARFKRVWETQWEVRGVMSSRVACLLLCFKSNASGPNIRNWWKLVIKDDQIVSRGLLFDGFIHFFGASWWHYIWSGGCAVLKMPRSYGWEKSDGGGQFMYNGHTFGCILHEPRATQLLILSKHDLDGTDESVEVILYKAVCRGLGVEETTHAPSLVEFKHVATSCDIHQFCPYANAFKTLHPNSKHIKTLSEDRVHHTMC